VGKEHSLSTVERDKREQCVRAPSPQMCGERERETDREKEERGREKKKENCFECVRKSWVSLWATNPCIVERGRGGGRGERERVKVKEDFFFFFLGSIISMYFVPKQKGLSQHMGLQRLQLVPLCFLLFEFAI
jgi:hypothetical protein